MACPAGAGARGYGRGGPEGQGAKAREDYAGPRAGLRPPQFVRELSNPRPLCLSLWPRRLDQGLPRQRDLDGLWFGQMRCCTSIIVTNYLNRDYLIYYLRKRKLGRSIQENGKERSVKTKNHETKNLPLELNSPKTIILATIYKTLSRILVSFLR